MNRENTNWQQSVTGVVIREGKVLLARHTYGAGKGRLIVPGGYVEQGETPQDAVRREIWEETGLVVELDPGFRVVTTYSPYPGCIKDVVYFTARAGDTETTPQPSEIQSLHWATLEEARAQLTYDNARDILDQAARYLLAAGEI